MKIREIKAYDRGREVRIFVSPLMKNSECEYGRTIRGYWYCVKGGEVGRFVTVRPESGCRISMARRQMGFSRIEESEMDIFNVNDPIDTKERFQKLLEL